MRVSGLSSAVFAAFLSASPVAYGADNEEAAIHDTYNAWVAVTNEKDIARWSAFLADESFFAPADVPPLTSRESILDYYRKSFADPAFALDCEQQEVEVSGSKDMAWSRGTCKVSFTGPDGEKASGASRWFKVWVRRPDGSWKCRVNSWKVEN
jgi:ketosteroid isomerase-like protein